MSIVRKKRLKSHLQNSADGYDTEQLHDYQRSLGRGASVAVRRFTPASVYIISPLDNE